MLLIYIMLALQKLVVLCLSKFLTPVFCNKKNGIQICFSFVAFIRLFKINLTVRFQYPVFANQYIRFYLDYQF